MVVNRVTRAPRAFTAAAVVTVALPLCLTACATAEDLGNRAAELRAANDSDLLAVPVERVYEVSSFELTEPQALSSLGEVAGSQLRHSGYVVLSDDVITEAELSFELVGVQSASFTLTEPTVIRRAEGETDPVYVSGDLTVGDREPYPATVKLTPTVIDEDALEFSLDFELPADLPFAENGLVPSEFSARIALTPEL